MITGVWLNKNIDAMHLAVQIDEDEIVILDFDTDPPTADKADNLDYATWLELYPYPVGCDKEDAS